jgi:hypothetical protein
MFERGIRQRLETRFRRTITVTCSKPLAAAAYASLDLQDIITSIHILAAGFIFSIVLFSIEWCSSGGKKKVLAFPSNVF